MERPLPILKTLAEDLIGVLGYAYNLKLNLKFNEVSELSFDLPRQVDGVETPYYRRVTAHKLIQLDPYGKFILAEPTVQGDGVREVKSCTARSLEQELENSNLFLEEGTYNFWNPLSTADTVLSRILEAAPGWTVGEVAPSLVGRYRTFDQVDAGALSFVYGDCQTAYECVFLFDPYLRQVYRRHSFVEGIRNGGLDFVKAAVRSSIGHGDCLLYGGFRCV